MGAAALAYYDDVVHNWVTKVGEFESFVAVFCWTFAQA